MKIYVASSWRCQYQPEAVQKLRALGHEVYDFRGPGSGWGELEGAIGGFGWKEVDRDWPNWPNDIPRYLRGLEHPRAIEGFNRDMDALRRADTCILVNPCGQSAHAELGFAAGAGKLTAAWCPAIREPDLMIKMASLVTDKWDAIEAWLAAAIKVFAMNDCDWYAAASLDDALREMADMLCYPATPEGIAKMREEHEVREPRELSSEAMVRLTFRDEDENESLVRTITFRQRLNELIAGGEQFPCFFASTEY